MKTWNLIGSSAYKLIIPYVAVYTGKYPRWFTDNALGLRPRALSETTSRIFPVYTDYLGYNLYIASASQAQATSTTAPSGAEIQRKAVERFQLQREIHRHISYTIMVMYANTTVTTNADAYNIIES